MEQTYKYFKRELDSKPALLAYCLEEDYDSQKCLSVCQRWDIQNNTFDNNPFHMIQIELDEFQEIGRIHNLFIFNDINVLQDC